MTAVTFPLRPRVWKKKHRWNSSIVGIYGKYINADDVVSHKYDARGSSLIIAWVSDIR